MSTKRSPVCNYFKVGEDTKFAICNSMHVASRFHTEPKPLRRSTQQILHIIRRERMQSCIQSY